MNRATVRSVVSSLLTAATVVAQPALAQQADSAAVFAESAGWFLPAALGATGGVPGLAIVVVRGGDVVLLDAFGTADVEADLKATPQTDYYIASSTKSFTALAAALLAARGELDLDASLASYFPDVEFDAEVEADRVTLRDLLAHTSGLSNSPIVFRSAFSGESEHADLVAALSATSANNGASRGTFEYTNLGYNIAGLVLDDVTGKPWQDVLAEEVFKPAGMERTTAYASLPLRRGWPVAAPYTLFGEHGRERIYLAKQDNTMQAAGGMYSTAADLGRWLVLQLGDGAIDGRQVFPAEVIRQTHMPVAETDADFGSFGRHGGYGLGWYIGEYGDETLIHHFGGFAGFRAHVSFMPDHDLGVAVLVNDSGAGGRLADMAATFAYDWWLGAPDLDSTYAARVQELSAGVEAAQARAAGSRAERAERTWQLTEPLEAYTGTYSSPLFGTAVVTIDDGVLAVRIGNMYAISTPFTRENTIRVELVPGRGQVVGFTLGEDGRTVSARLNQAVFDRVN